MPNITALTIPVPLTTCTLARSPTGPAATSAPAGPGHVLQRRHCAFQRRELLHPHQQLRVRSLPKQVHIICTQA